MVPARGSVALLAAFLASTITFLRARGPARSKRLLRRRGARDPRGRPAADGVGGGPAHRARRSSRRVHARLGRHRHRRVPHQYLGDRRQRRRTAPAHRRAARRAAARWSPDGRTLAFTRAAEGKPAQIHLLPMAGGEATPLTRLMGGASQPVWSPDGTRILFASSTNPQARRRHRREPSPSTIRDASWCGQCSGSTARASSIREHPEPSVGGECHGRQAAPAHHRRLRGGRWSVVARRQVICFVSDHRTEPWFAKDNADLFEVPVEVVKPVNRRQRRWKSLVDVDGPIAASSRNRATAASPRSELNPEQARSVTTSDDLRCSTDS